MDTMFSELNSLRRGVYVVVEQKTTLRISVCRNIFKIRFLNQFYFLVTYQLNIALIGTKNGMAYQGF